MRPADIIFFIVLPLFAIGLLIFAARRFSRFEFAGVIFLMLSITFGLLGVACVFPPNTFERLVWASQPYLSLVLLAASIWAFRIAAQRANAQKNTIQHQPPMSHPRSPNEAVE